MKTEYANAPTPTLFHLFLTDADEAEAIEQKRFVRRACEAVGTAIGRTVRYKTTDQAGQRLENGVAVSVPGFNVFACASNEDQSYADDKRALMAAWWNPAGLAAIGVNRVIKQSAHAPGYELEFGSDIQAFVEGPLKQTFTKPDVWTKREEKAAAAAAYKAEVAKKREERAAAKAQKVLDAAKAAQVEADAAATAAPAETETDEPVAEAA